MSGFRTTSAAVALVLMVAACGGSGGADPTSGTNSDPNSATTIPASGEGETTTAAPDVGGTTSGELPDTCSLLTPEDLESFAGLAFNDGVLNSSRTIGESVCEWLTTESTPKFGVVQLVVSSFGYDDMKDAASTVSDLMDVEVAGADRAFADVSGSPVGAEANGLYVQVTYSGSDQNTLGANTSDLAEIAVANLP